MFTLTRYGCHIILLLLLGTMAACSSNIKAYPNKLDKNLHIKTNSSVNTAVDIFQVNPDCSITYSGTVKLNKKDVDIGIPAGRSSYLAFAFSSSDFLSGESTTSFSTLLRPRKNSKYDIDVSYQDNIYNVVIYERPGANKKREIETKDLSACRPL